MKLRIISGLIVLAVGVMSLAAEIVDSGTGSHVASDPGTSGSRVLTDLPPNQDFQLVYSPAQQLLSGGAATSTTVRDAVLTSTAASTARSWSNLQVIFPINGQNIRGQAVFASNNAGVLPISSQGVIAPTADGTATITVTVPGLGSKNPKITATTASFPATTTFSNYVSGSLADHTTSQILTLLSGHTAPTFTQVSGTGPGNAWGYHFVASSHICDLFLATTTTDGTPITTSPLTRNPNCWASSLDLSPIPWSFPLGAMNVCPITKRDLLAAGHYHAGIGTQYKWIGTDGVTYTRTIVAQTSVAGATSDGWDLWVDTLDSDLPATVTIPQMIPASVWTHLPDAEYGYSLVYVTQDYRILVGSDTYASGSAVWGPQAPTNATLAPWYCPVRGGDSSSPMFFLINGKLVLISPLGSSGLNGWANIAAINAAIVTDANSLSSSGTPYPSPYTVSTFDPSAFPSY